MSLAQFLALKDKQDPLVMEPINWLIVLHKWAKGAPYMPTSLLSGADLLPSLDPGWMTTGELQKKAAIDISPDTKTSDIEGLGSTSARSTKITKEDLSLDYVAQEYRKVNLENFHNTDMSGVVWANGEWRARKRATSQVRFYSALVVGFSGLPGAEVYPFFALPKVASFKRGKSTLNDEGAVELPATLNVFEDGYLYDFGVAGPGYAPLAAAAGFLSAPTAIDVQPPTGSVAVNGVLQLTVLDSNGADRTAECTFSSSNTGRATVSSSGRVTGVATGSAATITATFGSLTDTASVVVS